MTMKHTPGPWTVLPLSGKYYGTKVQVGDDEIEVWTPDHFAQPFASPREIAKGWDPAEEGHDHVEDQQSYANACLIAAAPDLLEALLAVVKHYGVNQFFQDAEPFNKARAAIAKATGAVIE